jgi:hypothetical protein
VLPSFACAKPVSQALSASYAIYLVSCDVAIVLPVASFPLDSVYHIVQIGKQTTHTVCEWRASCVRSALQN